MSSQLASVGVRGGDGSPARKKEFWEEYDSISPRMAAEIAKYESAPRHMSSGSQTQERVHYLREENIEARKKYRIEHQDELKQQRTGRILHMNHFLLLVRNTGLKAWYNSGGAFPGMLGFNVQTDDGRTSYSPGFAQVPYAQEFEEVWFDEYDVPLGPKRRGWRTLVLRLILEGILTEEKAHEVFGAPPTNPTTARYWRELKRFREKK